MKHLTIFETQAAYSAAESNLILPNVSLITADGDVKYKAASPTPTHDYVEIGGVKWATMNIGATGITDTGLYFQWGDTQGYTTEQVGCEEGKKCFSDNDYIYYNYGYTKYNETDGKTVLEASDDAVTAAWGGGWRMPTKDEYVALGNAVNTARAQVNGVSGVMCTDKTDETKTLFFPACGFAVNGNVSNVGHQGGYWSSSLVADTVNYAYNLLFIDGYVNWQYDEDYRPYGFPVRGVVGE